MSDFKHLSGISYNAPDFLSQGTIGMDTDEMQTGGLMPITVPLADPKLYDLKLKGHAQEKTSFATTAVNSEGILPYLT